MGKRYYCEFCDKLFADNPTNKRNHLKGVFHQRMKKLHYDAFKDPEEILKEESCKMPCRQMETTGDCSFGDSCRYSHLTTERRQTLEKQVQAKRDAALKAQQEADREVRLEDWLVMRQKSGDASGPVSAQVAPPSLPPENAESPPVYSLPPALMMIPNLPPSLLPPPPGTNLQASREEWG
ncbi:zinc finger matrin-type protein 5-like [Liolophura sinensis]|uniref:zinc finger matrin-type protein 5-like n=1 Tax=Liolophura sinensis TaxID=3198878 RepID=UPI0031588B93